MKITGRVTTECCYEDHDNNILEFNVVEVGVLKLEHAHFYCEACSIYKDRYGITIYNNGDTLDHNLRHV